MSIVRIAGPTDREEILRLLELAHGEIGLFNLDWPSVCWWVDRMLWPERLATTDTGPRGIIGVIGEPEHLEGMAFLIIGGVWYSTQKILQELILYVEPKYRVLRHARTLIGWMKMQSCLTGLPLTAGIMTTERTEAKIRLYAREIPKAGATFKFDPTITAGSSISLMVH